MAGGAKCSSKLYGKSEEIVVQRKYSESVSSGWAWKLKGWMMAKREDFCRKTRARSPKIDVCGKNSLDFIRIWYKRSCGFRFIYSVTKGAEEINNIQVEQTTSAWPHGYTAKSFRYRLGWLFHDNTRYSRITVNVIRILDTHSSA